ncbi:AI-2E family transporter [Aquipuribacter sp. MA13-6]|uniref:AI-2E family transporter n=1 Tax=unclassified Aquipuribacter TaxID=2635084 RepID=UPI003EF0373D
MAASPGGDTLRRAGAAAWSWLGIIGLGAVLVLGLSAVAGLVVPFVVAVVVAVLLVPLVDLLQARRVPRTVAALLVLLGFLGVLVGVIWLAVSAVASQWSVVTGDLRAGLAWAVQQLDGLGIDVQSPATLLRRGLEVAGTLALGPASAVVGALGSITSFLIGTTISMFLLFLMLADWHRLTGWTHQRLWVPAPVGHGMVTDVVDSLRRYYLALTLSSVVVALVITVTAWLLGVPLALAIGVVTLVTSYVPYLGAIFSAAVAVLIALGAAGPFEAVVLLLVILLVQNLVQTVIQAKLTGAALQLHPIVTFSATIVGAAVAGILGASLAVPVLAGARRVVARLRDHREAAAAAGAALSPPAVPTSDTARGPDGQDDPGTAPPSLVGTPTPPRPPSST